MFWRNGLIKLCPLPLSPVTGKKVLCGYPLRLQPYLAIPSFDLAVRLGRFSWLLAPGPSSEIGRRIRLGWPRGYLEASEQEFLLTYLGQGGVDFIAFLSTFHQLVRSNQPLQQVERSLSESIASHLLLSENPELLAQARQGAPVNPNPQLPVGPVQSLTFQQISTVTPQPQNSIPAQSLIAPRQEGNAWGPLGFGTYVPFALLAAGLPSSEFDLEAYTQSPAFAGLVRQFQRGMQLPLTPASQSALSQLSDCSADQENRTAAARRFVRFWPGNYSSCLETFHLGWTSGWTELAFSQYVEGYLDDQGSAESSFYTPALTRRPTRNRRPPGHLQDTTFQSSQPPGHACETT